MLHLGARERGSWLDRPCRVRLCVFDIAGRLVRVLEDEPLQEAGVHRVSWNGTNASGTRVSSGIYFYRLEAGAQQQTRKAIHIR